MSCLLVAFTTGIPLADIGDYPMQPPYDSYAVIPKVQDTAGVSELSLDIVPPAMFESSAPHMFYMGSDGVAVPVEESPQRRIVRKRAAIPANPSADETLVADETVIIGPPSGNRPFGTPAVNLDLGFRPARAYYARRYHKYPWNYH